MSQLGFYADIAILSIAFILIIIFRKKITALLLKIKLPRFLLFLLVSVPFLLFEESINCQQYNCTFPVLNTIPMLLVFMLILGVFVKLFKAKRVWLSVIIFSILGILFEVFLGIESGGAGDLHPAMLIFMLFWIGISYAFVSLIPLKVLMAKKNEQ